MRSTRKAIMDALQARLATAAAFALVGRRGRDPENMPSPSLIILKRGEHYSGGSTNIRKQLALMIDAIVYVDVGTDETAVPGDVIDVILDGIDAALRPDSPAEGKCTLGGRVEAAQIDGEVEIASGDVTGKALAIVPIRILAP